MHLPLPARVLSKLIQVIGYVSSSRDDIFAIAAKQILDMFDVDACVFAVEDDQGNRCTSITSKDPELQKELEGSGCTGHCAALKDGLMMCIEDSQREMGCSGGLVNDHSSSHLCIPLAVRGQRMGVMTVAARKPHVFSPEEIDLYLAVGSLVAIAVQNAEHHSVTERHAEELRVEVHEQTRIIRAINVVSERINAASTRTQVVQALETGLPGIVHCDWATLAQVDDAGFVSVAVVYGAVDETEFRLKTRIDETVLHELGKTGKARVQTGAPPPKAACLVGSSATSYAIAPLVVEDRVLGCLSIASCSGSNLTHSVIPQLSQIAGQVAAALSRIELFERERIAKAELETLYRASRALTSTVMLRDTYRIIARQLSAATSSDACLLFAVENGASMLVASHGGSIERTHPSLRVALPQDLFNSTLSAKVWRPMDGTGVISGWLASLASHLGPNVMLAPIRDRDSAIAMAILARSGRSYGEAELRLATLLAGQAAVAIQASQTYEHERTIAEAFQKNLLPPPDYRRVGLSVASKYQAALDEAEVGGDFYDIIEIDDSHVGIAVGDISGKGLSAAIQAAATKYMLEAYALEDPEPGIVLARLNAATCRSGGERFVTLFYALIDLERGVLTYANAGHELPMHIKQGELADPLEVTGPALSLFDEATYGERTLRMGSGDLVLCYTDGITEARSGHDLWGYEGLSGAIRQCASIEPRIVVEHVYERALEYANGRLADDAVLLAMCQD